MDSLMTKISTINDLKSLYVETLLNYTNKISKITDLSVLNAHSYAIAKLLQKDLKETAILESQLFPQLSSGQYLDSAALYIGGGERLGSTGSSSYVRVNADPGTQYIPGVTYFISSNGVQFDIIDPILVGDNGYNYIPVRSSSNGSNTNVPPFSINKAINQPQGHINCTNEYTAVGGRDIEGDEDFKIRLSTFGNIQSKSTQLNILENLKLLDKRIINIIRYGIDEYGKISFGLVTCNGVNFIAQELKSLENKLSDFVTISDLNLQGNNIGISLVNINYFYFDIDFRISILPDFDESLVRNSIQINLTKYFNFKNWKRSKIEWDDILGIVKNVSGVDYIPDEYFGICVSGGSPVSSDIMIKKNDLPRIKSFIMRDVLGNILYNNNNSILPVYYI